MQSDQRLYQYTDQPAKLWRHADSKLTELSRLPTFFLLAAITMSLMTLLLGNPALAAAPADRIYSGAQMYWYNNPEEIKPAITLDTHYALAINGPIASIHISQSFHHQGDSWSEGIYVYPLPENASVHHLAITTDSGKVIGQIQEKGAAKKAYQQAKRQGKQSALLEQKRDNIFRQAIANIAPGETVSVELQLSMAVDYQHPTFSLNLPTTLTPRYRIESTAPENDFLTTPTGERISLDANYQMTIDIRVYGDFSGQEFFSRSHDIDVLYDRDHYRVSPRKDRITMDRDFHIGWKLPANSPAKPQFFTERVAGDDYGLLMLTPPTASVATLAQDIIFIIDTSGSMGGKSIQQAKQSIIQALQHLEPGDHFNIIDFNDDFSSLFEHSKPATADNIARAVRHVSRLQASGGTEMLPPLMQALSTPVSGDRNLRQLVLITDGAVDYETDLLTLIHNQLGNARLFTVGIGTAANGFFIRKAAQFGRGSYVSVQNQQHISEQMAELFNTLNSAVLADIEIQWPVGIEAWPEKIPDLYQNQPLQIAIKLNRSLNGDDDTQDLRGHIYGYYSDGSLWQDSFSLAAPKSEPKQAGGIAKLWARQKISALLDNHYTGSSRDEIESAVLPIALKHSLLSPFTSFVAISEQARREPGEPVVTQHVALTPPAGATIYAPQTATASLPLLWLGALLVVCALSLGRRGVQP